MTDPDRSGLIPQLKALARAAALAADPSKPSAELVMTYEQLRATAYTLNERHHLSSANEFATELPTLEDLALIDHLDNVIGAASEPTLPNGRPSSERLVEALRWVSGWATGIRLAYETFE